MVYIAEGAKLLGDTQLQENVNIWYNAVLRADEGPIEIGENTNIQDNCVVHDETTIGSGCTIGHGAIVHGCTIGNNCLIGMGSIILNNAEIGDNCVIGAGTLVTRGKKIPAGSMVYGNPAKIIRPLTEDEIQFNRWSAEHYVEIAKKSLSAK